MSKAQVVGPMCLSERVRRRCAGRHYGKWVGRKGPTSSKKWPVGPPMAPRNTILECQKLPIFNEEKCERGDLNPHGFYSTGS
jgi:hypothetical protein